MLDHAREFRETFQRKLAPAAAYIGSFQCVGERLSLAPQPRFRLGQGVELLRQCTLCGGPFLLDLVQLALGFRECVADRIEQLANGLLALLEVTRGTRVL